MPALAAVSSICPSFDSSVARRAPTTDPNGAGSFAGFRPAALTFLEQLAANQNREWFQAHKSVYDTELRAPMGALVDALAFAFEVHDIPLTGDATRSLFRIHRDVRFARDKTPYKTNVSAVLSRDGTRHGSGILYIQVGGEAGGFMALGFYELDPADLTGFRQMIVRDPARWTLVEAGLAKHKLTLSRDGALTRIPRGFETHAGSPLADVLKLKHFVVRRPIAMKRLFQAALLEDIVAFAQAGLPLLMFGRAAVAR